MDFQINALPIEPFAPLFQLSDVELAARRMRRISVTEKPGTPCRVSLVDAEAGETVLLLNHEHQPADSPYRASHAIFVRERAVRAVPEVNTVPEVFARRLLSLRLFDDQHMMIGADVIEGCELKSALAAAFDNRAVAYVHIHNAKPGCFAASATRAGEP